ncbi:MAG TPA: chemotaxis protein CheB [Gaiellaceae bacterium]
MAANGQGNQRAVIVIGASAGGVEALRTVAAGLPPELEAAVFVVLHLAAGGTSVLPEILERAGDLPAIHPDDGEEIENGCIYVAPPDHHLLVEDGNARIVRGPRENGHRPAIDTLFRSAARVYGPRAVGVILSGVLDDGAAGLAAVKAAGGHTVVQSPSDALYDGMPLAAIEGTQPDHVVPAAEIAELLAKLVTEAATEPPETATPGEEVLEESLVAVDRGSTDQPQPGHPSGFTCPECNGALWQADEAGVLRFRCRTGHQFSVETLLAQQSASVEAAMWSALRALEERAAMLRRLAQRMSARGNRRVATRYARVAEHTVQHALTLRDALHAFHAPPEAEDEDEPIEQVP